MDSFFRLRLPYVCEASFVAAIAATTGCGGPSFAVSATAEPDPDNVVTSTLHIETSGAKRVQARYGDDTSYGSETPWFDVPDDGKVTTALLGLTPDHTSHVVVTAESDTGEHVSTDDIAVRASAIPDAVRIPKMTFAVDDGTASGYILAVPTVAAEGNLDRGTTGLMIDRRGRPQWYGVDAGYGTVLQRLPNGHFIFDQNASALMEELDLAGDEVRDWTAPKYFLGVQSHEFVYLPDEDAAWVLGYGVSTAKFPAAWNVQPAWQRGDSTAMKLVAGADAKIVWSTDTIRFEDRVGCYRTPLTGETGVTADVSFVEACHANSIELVPDGTPEGKLLISCRVLSAIVLVDPTNGKMLWRLGGNDAAVLEGTSTRTQFAQLAHFTFATTGPDVDPAADPTSPEFNPAFVVRPNVSSQLTTVEIPGPSCQHDVRLAPETMTTLTKTGHASTWRVRMLDNGANRTRPETRAVEYELHFNADGSPGQATFVRDFRHSPPLFSPISGSSRELASGNWLVDFANVAGASTVDEVVGVGRDKSKERVIWELTFPDAWVFRDEYVDTLYPPRGGAW